MDWRAFGIALVVIVVLWSLAMVVARRQLFARFQRHFMAGDFDGALKVLDGFIAGQAFPEFNLNYMRLNALEAKGDDERERELIEQMLRLKCNDEQRRALLERAFSFYSSQKDRERCERVLELMESLGDKDLVRESRQTFDIVFKGSYAHIAEMEHELADAAPERRATLNYLLSLQYENKGDAKRAEEYLKRSVAGFGVPTEL